MDKLYIIIFVFQLIAIGLSVFYMINSYRLKKQSTILFNGFAILFSLSVLSVFSVASDFEFIPLLIKNISALLFYVFIITTPPFLYNFLLLKIDSNKKSHIKVFYVSYVLFLINIISFVYLTFKPGNTFFHTVIENLMNYSNFATYIFVFPIITVYYFIQILKLILQNRTNDSNQSLITLIAFGYFAFIFLHLITQFNEENFSFKISFLVYVLLYTFILTFLIIKENSKSFKDNTSRDEKEKYFSEIAFKLTKVIEEDRPYLDAKLTIYQLAKLIDSNEKYLSHYLNCVHEVNFYTYINNFRIEEAKKLLLSEEAENYTIETIANMSGFHSKSSFNSAFKKSTEMTPSEYRKIHIY
jgi:AraC-like DNA-binding protein